MARLAYLILSRSGAIDQTKNTASFFHVVETVTVSPAPPDATPQEGRARPQHHFFLVAVFLREEGDAPDQEFESQTMCLLPSGDTFFESAVTSFRFSSPFHRLYVPDLTLHGYPALGLYELKARLRRAGEQQWHSEQTFPFLVLETPREAPSPDQ
jgi:hypothetical protein